MTDGHKLFVTANFAFDYDAGHLAHLTAFDAILHYFGTKCHLKGFTSNEEGVGIEDGTAIATLLDKLWDGFDKEDVPRVVVEYLKDYKMYEVLTEYYTPLDGEALMYKQEIEKKGWGV